MPIVDNTIPTYGKKKSLVDTGPHQGFSSTINAQSGLKLQVLGVVSSAATPAQSSTDI